jgi:GntR family transcriptional regulator
VTSPPTLVVDSADPTPPYEQLRRQLAELVGSRVLAPGDRLPPVRQLAADLGLAVGTVARAYRELESAGLVRSRRGAGTRVAAGSAALSDATRRSLLAGHAAAFVHQARLLGVPRPEIIAAIDVALTEVPD